MKKILFSIIPLLIITITFSNGCKKEAPESTTDKSNVKVIEEYPLIEIPLPEFLAGRKSELSGLSWFEDQLILLPQYPKLMGENISSNFFGISKKDILDFLKTKDSSKLHFYKIKLIEEGLEKYSELGSGYEAITFIGNTAFLTIEYMNDGKTESLIVKGNFDFENKTLELDPSSLKKILSEDEIHNLSNETVTRFGNQIIPIYEANGKSITSEPKVSLYDEILNFKKFLSLPNIEYRITDATDADSTGKFWVMNYFYPKDFDKLKPQDDIIVKKYGIGKSHKESPAVERLVELEIKSNEIKFSDRKPIYLKLLVDGSGRNWEGLVKLDNIGFVIATDTFPKTILAFIAAKINNDQ